MRKETARAGGFLSLTGRKRVNPLTATISALVMLSFATPMAQSCQSTQADRNRGIEELRSLVRISAGKPAPADLLRLESKYSRTRTAALANFLRAYLYHAAQNYEAAVEAIDPGRIAESTSLGDYALFYRAESQAQVGKKSEALREFAALYTRYADSMRAREARLRAAELSISLGDPGSALTQLATLSKAGDADAVLLTARSYEAKGENEQAVALYRRIYYEMPATSACAQAEAKLAAMGVLSGNNSGTFDEEKGRADRLYEAKQYAEASKAYELLSTRLPQAAQSDDVQLRWGVSLLNNKQPAQALLSLSKVGANDTRKHAESLFYQAEALRKLNRTPESAVIVDKLVTSHRESRRAIEALFNLASYFNKEGRETEAASRFRQLLSQYPSSEYAAEASYALGWRAYRSGSYAEAARILEQHLTRYRSPQTKFIGESGFWAAKSHEKLGNRSRALALYDLVSARYSHGYHGHFARLRAAALRRADPKLRPEQPAPGSDLSRIIENVRYVEPIAETADDSQRARLAKADDLEVIGLSDIAIRELNRILEDAPSSPLLNLRLAQIYAHRGENFQATLVLRRGYSDIYSYSDADLPREAWDIFFPLTNWDTIKQEAKKFGVDPYNVAGLIRQESVFNPTAISRVGARGLMQLMPATGQLVAKRQGNGRISATDLYNPVLNIKLGMDYLAQMQGEFGRLEYAAAAYNAGPARVKRWLAERGSMDLEDWIESIPILETRGYVQGVIRYAANYRRFYKE